MLLGIFLILVGILIFVYWILLPVSEKEKILQDIYKENITLNRNYSIDEKKLNVESITLNNIYLYSGKKEIIISENYTVGELIKFREIALENIFIKTNIFSGVKTKILVFPYYEDNEGVLISFILKCNNGKIEILVNDILFFEGCFNDLQEIYIQKEYLNKDSNKIKIKFYPNSIFSDAIFEIRNLKVIFVKKNEIVFDYFYNYDEKVFLIYNFCPTDPNALEFYINDIRIPFYTCSHNSFDVTQYLRKGKNTFILKSNIRTKINLKLLTTSSIYTRIFNLTEKDYMLYIVKNRGSGTVYINKCKFYLDSYRNVFVFALERDCVNEGENIIVIRPDTFLEISSILLK